VKKYRIEIIGCDDTTIIEADLDEDGANTIAWLSKKSIEKSWYECMPTVVITEIIENEQATN